jgi:hypothetical protein
MSVLAQSAADREAAFSFAAVLRDPELVLRETLEPPSTDAILVAFEELVEAGALRADEIESKSGSGKTGPAGKKTALKPAENELTFWDDPSPTGPAAAAARSASAVGAAMGDPILPSYKQKKQRNKPPSSGSTVSDSSATDAASTAPPSKFVDVDLTPLGRFLAQVPFAFDLGRALAFAVTVHPVLIPHCVIIAAALSQQEVYLLPHPRMMSDPKRYVSMVAHSTFGRIRFDQGRLSDIVSVVDLIREYATMSQFIARRGSSGNTAHAILHNTPDLLKNLDERPPLHDPLATWNFVHGISFDRLKMLLNTVSEISLRLTGLLPHHAANLTALATLARGGRAARSKHMQARPESGAAATSQSSRGPDLLEIDIGRLLPMDEDALSILHLILSTALNRHLLVGKMALQPPVRVAGVPAKHCPPDQMLMLPAIPVSLVADETLLQVPELQLFRPFIDGLVTSSAHAASSAVPVGMAKPMGKGDMGVPAFVRFAPVDICPPVVWHATAQSEVFLPTRTYAAPTEREKSALATRFFTTEPSVLTSASAARNPAVLSHAPSHALSRFYAAQDAAADAFPAAASAGATATAATVAASSPWSTFGGVSPSRVLLTTPGGRVVSAPPFASLVFQRMFWSGKFAVSPPSFAAQQMATAGRGQVLTSIGGIKAGPSNPFHSLAQDLRAGLASSETAEAQHVRAGVVSTSTAQVELNMPRALSSMKFTPLAQKKGKPVRFGSQALASAVLQQLHLELTASGLDESAAFDMAAEDNSDNDSDHDSSSDDDADGWAVGDRRRGGHGGSSKKGGKGAPMASKGKDRGKEASKKEKQAKQQQRQRAQNAWDQQVNSMTQQMTVFAVASNVMTGADGQLRAEKLSVLPFATPSQRMCLSGCWFVDAPVCLCCQIF